MSAEVWYLDSSALVKTLIDEPESGALMRWLTDKEQLVACELIRVETVRAVRVSDPDVVPRARRELSTLTMIRLEDSVYDAAADLNPVTVRSLDAVHLAAALSLGPDLRGLVTYDPRIRKRPQRSACASKRQADSVPRARQQRQP